MRHIRTAVAYSFVLLVALWYDGGLALLVSVLLLVRFFIIRADEHHQREWSQIWQPKSTPNKNP